MARKIPTIAIVGRTNVGKSTLFNAIAGRRLAIVEDTPGVTRDRHYALVSRFGWPFSLIDTGGMAGEQEEVLEDSVREQTQLAIEQADLVLCVFDGMEGPTPHDKEVVDQLRRLGKPTFFVANKTESPVTQTTSSEFYTLGIDNIHNVSAVHHQGVRELIEVVREFFGDTVGPIERSEEEKKQIRVAIVGKPNVGKSSLVNRILGDDRLITSDVPGTTRDSIDITLVREGQEFVIVDTAGLRKKSHVDDMTIERFGNLRTLRALVMADVAVLVLDATQDAPTDQDIRIAALIHERGRPMIIVVNKWDAVEKDHRTAKELEDGVHAALRVTRYAPVLFVSALTGQRCPSVLKKAREVFEGSRVRVKTSDLNRVLGKAFSRRPPPVYRGEPVKLFFATQVEVSPPTFVLFVNQSAKLGGVYQRYLLGQLRREYPFSGTDIRLIFRKRTSKSQRDGEGSEREKSDGE